MKLRIFPLLGILFTLQGLAQSPSLNYQGAVRDSLGNLLRFKPIGLRFEIMDGPTVVYSEQQVQTTDINGLFNTQIGKTGTLSPQIFSKPLFIKIGLDVNGGTNFSFLSSQPLNYVPYAMKAENVPSTFSNNVLSIGLNTYTLSSGITYTPGAGISINSGTVVNTAPDQTVDIAAGSNMSVSGTYPNFTVSSSPTLDLNGGSLSISGGNTVTLPTVASPSISGGNNVSVSGAHPSFTIASTPTLTLSGNSLSISGGNTVSLQSFTPTSISNSGIATVSALGNNSFNVNVPGPGITTQGIITQTTSGANFSLNVPGPGIATSGIITQTTSGANFSLNVPAPTLSTSGVATQTTSGNNFTINVPAPQYNNATGVLTTGASVTTISHTLAVNANSITIGPAGNTVTVPVTAISTVGILQQTVSGNNYTLGVQAPAITTLGVITQTTSGNNFTLNVPAPQYNNATGVLTTGASVTTISHTLSVNANSITIGPAGNTVTVPVTAISTVGILQQTVSGNNYTLGVQAPAITTLGVITQTTSGNNFTLNVPAPQYNNATGVLTTGASVTTISHTLSVNSNTITIGPAGNSVTVPVTATTAITAGSNVSVGGAFPNYVINATPSLVLSTNTLSITGANSITIPTASITTTGALSKTVSLGNYTLDMPFVNIAQQGAATVIAAYPNFTVAAPAQIIPSITGQGAANVTTASPANFTVSVSQTTITAGTNVNVGGGFPNFVINATPSLSANSNTISISGANSITVPITATTAITSGSNVSVGGSFPNYVINATPSLSANSNTISISGANSITVPITATTAITAGSNITVGGSFPNYVIDATPSLSANSNTISISGANSITVPVTATTAITAGSNITVGGSFPNYVIDATPSLSANNNTISISGANSITVPITATTAITSGSNVTVGGAFPNYVINATPSLSANSNTISISGANSITVPVTATTAITAGSNVTVGGSFPNYVINATPSLAVNSNSISITGGNTVTFQTTPVTTLQVTGGGATSTTLATNNFSIDVPQGTLTPSGIVTITPIGTNSFNVNVPAPAYNNTTGVLTSGSATTLVAPQLSISASMLYAGPVSNSVSLAGISPWTQNSGTVSLATSSDFVGIGTNTPVAMLDINGQSGNNTGLIIRGHKDIIGAAIPFAIEAVTSGQTYGTNTYGRIVRLMNTTIGSAYDFGIQNNGDLFLSYLNSYSPPYFAMTTGGNIGIGTASPAEKFQVESGGNSFASIISGNSSQSSLWFGKSAAHGQGKIVYDNNNNSLNIWTNGITDRLTIDNAGNVGIRTINPGADLGILNTGNSTVLRLMNSGAPAGLTMHQTTTYAGLMGNENLPMYFGTNGFQRMVISATGEVGIGTMNPSSKLHVVNNFTNAGGNGIYFQSVTSGASGANSLLYNDMAGSSTGNYISGYFRSEMMNSSTGNATAVKGLAVSSNPGIGNVVGVDGSATNGANNVGVFATASGGSGTTNYALYASNQSTVGTNWAGYFDGPAAVDGKLTFMPRATPPATFAGAGHVYYDTGSQKLKVSENGGPYVNLVGGSGWGLGGNSGTSPGTNFIGTSDAQDLAIRTNSVEAVRISTTGNVGIGFNNPSAKLEVIGGKIYVAQSGIRSTAQMDADANTSFLGLQGLTENVDGDFYWRAYWGAVIDRHGGNASGGTATNYGDGGFAVRYKTATNTFRTDLLINDAGNIGIGTTTPHAPLQFNNNIVNRKIVLWEGANNDHQFYGFGINNSELRYQTDASVADHVFFSGINSTSSQELMRIKGTGQVGIGTSAPSANLHVQGSVRLVDGNQANGRVLTSDANGNATWQTPTSGGWGLTGNASTTPGVNFVGTTDAKELILSSNNVPAVTIYTTGMVSVAGGPSLQQSSGKLSISAATSTNYAYGVQTYLNNTPSSGMGGVTAAGRFDNITNASGGGASFNLGLMGYDMVQGNNTSLYNAGAWLHCIAIGGTHQNIMGVIGAYENVGGNVTNGYGGYFEHWSNSGTITNGYGVFIGTILGTNKWGLYSADANARNYFAGKVGIGTSAPPNMLAVGNTPGDSQIFTTRIYSTSVNPGQWAGSAAVGGTAATAVMGQLYDKATIGGHNANLSSWADLMINPVGGNVGIGTGTVAPTAVLTVSGTTRFIDGNQGAGKVLTSDASGNASWQSASASSLQVCFLKDVKSSGTNGGSSIANTWLARDLNTIEGSTVFVNLSANQFTLQAGTYMIRADVPHYSPDIYKSRLRNISDNVDQIVGQAMFGHSGNGVSNASIIMGVFTITSAKAFQIQYFCTTAQAVNGLGTQVTGSGLPEVYTQVQIMKLQ